MPHMPGVWHMPPGHEGISLCLDFPPEWAANVDNSGFKWDSPQDGHAGAAPFLTSFSNLVPQSSQRYS